MIDYQLMGIILIFLIFTFINIILHTRKSNTITQDEYIIAIKTLELIVDNYKNTLYLPKIDSLSKEFDTRKDSKFNAIHQFEKVINEILQLSVSDIITNYISQDIMKILKKCFNSNGLILFITTYLRGQ